jgi:excisionase family DNA binding protein
MVTSSKLSPTQTVQRSNEISNPKPKRLYTLKEAAEYLGRSEWGMRELAWAGRIPVVKPEGGRKIFFDILDLMEFIEKNKSTYL